MDKWYILEFYVGRNPHPFYTVGRDTPDEALRWEIKFLCCIDHEGESALIKHDEIVSISIYQFGNYTDIFRTWEEMENE